MEDDVGRLFDDDAVLQRTARGQAAVLRAVSPLSPAAQLLLTAVNGFTPLRPLLDLLPLRAEEVRTAIVELYRYGLLEPRAEAGRRDLDSAMRIRTRVSAA
jgi:hypothetical protein